MNASIEAKFADEKERTAKYQVCRVSSLKYKSIVFNKSTVLSNKKRKKESTVQRAKLIAEVHFA